MAKKPLPPVIGVPACMNDLDGKPFHTVGDKYVRALAVSAGALPVMIPSLGENLLDLRQLLSHLDGVMLTGSPSNVHPSHYGQPESPEAAPFDLARDATTLGLVHLALEEGVPLLAICRGYQELNVALGGTLHPRVHEIPGRMDHRGPKDPDLDVQYGPRHPVTLRAGGPLEAFARAAGIEGPLMVNSLHWQALDRLADRLIVEAEAADGTPEAVSVSGAKGFALGVQWHPEYKAWENPFSRQLFEAFGAAARARAAARAGESLRPLAVLGRA